MTARTQLLLPSWIAPVEPARTVLQDHALAMRDGRIVELAPRDEALARHPDADRVDLPGRLLIPGLVNLHAHLPMALLRGAGDDLPLHRWLNERIWPIETRLMSDAFGHDGALLAGWELLRGGTTCVNDMYFHADAVARALGVLGMRAVLGIVVLGFATSWASAPDEYLAKGFALRDRLADDPLFGFTLAPHAPYTVSDDTFGRIATLSAELGLPIHCHVHETAQEVADSVAAHGVRPLARLDALGVVGPDLIAVHAVHLSDAEIDLLAARGASVAHCPHSNLKLGSGIARTAVLRQRGVNVGIGTDGSASNNRLDMLAEARTAALLAKGASGDAAAWDAHATLEAATLAGARALGMESRIGSLAPGKAADIAAIDLGDVDFRPMHDPVSQLVYMCSREQVSDVWVAGRAVVRNRQPVDSSAAEALAEVTARVAVWQNRSSDVLAGRS